jgi:hypothetical protein
MFPPSLLITICPVRFSGSWMPSLVSILSGSFSINWLTLGRAGGFWVGAMLKAE